MRIHYDVGWDDPADHLFEVRVRIEGVEDEAISVAMPAWIPGAYEVLDPAKHVSALEARGPKGSLPWTKTDKQTWRVACPRERRIEIRYRCYANTVSCIASSLDRTHAHLTGGTVLLYPVGHCAGAPCSIRVPRPRGWRIATGLDPTADPRRFTAPEYDALIDCPIEIGPFLHDRFRVAGKTHHLVLHPYGKETANRRRLLRDTRAMVAAFSRMFRGLPYEHYWFLFHLHPTIARGGALEHRNSTHLTTKCYLDSDDPEDYVRLIDVVAHEFFHTWNVKRLRPKGLGPFDYSREAYTPDLWVAEGITDYYGTLGLRRAGVWDDAAYFRRLGATIDRLRDMPARRSMNLKESSLETWTQAYWHRAFSRDDVDSPNRYVDYYTKGMLVGLALDLEIRVRTRGRLSLDDAMRRLVGEFGSAPEGFPEGAFEAAASEVAGANLSRFFRAHVEGTAEMDFSSILARAGLRLRRGKPTRKEEDSKSRRKILGSLGLEVDDRADPPKVGNVFPDSPARRAGVERDDVLLARDGEKLTAKNWRASLGAKKPGRPLDLAVFRHDRLLHLRLRPVPDRRGITRISRDPDASEAARRLGRGWLGPPSRARTTEARRLAGEG